MRRGRTCSTRRIVISIVLAASAVFFNPTLPGAAKSIPSPSAPAFAPTVEYVKTYAADCVTPQTTFYLGDTVCAEAGGLSGPTTSPFWRFQWATPGGRVVDRSYITASPQTDSFTIPTTGQFAQYGTWLVTTADVDAGVRSVAKFIVRHPKLHYADLRLTKAGPALVYPGETISYRLWLHNPGPDPAESIEIVDEVPTNMVFVALKQASGEPIECSTPVRGETGRSICKMPRLSYDQAIELVAYYQVNPDAKGGTSCTSAAQVSSLTADQNKEDNIVRTESTVTQEK